MQSTQHRIGDFYLDTVLPALASNLDIAFPEFGWKRDARGWVATNQEMTHRVLGVRADRVVAHGDAPSGFLVHGGDATLWTAYLNGGVVPRGQAFRGVVEELATRAGLDPNLPERNGPRDRRADLLEAFFALCRAELQDRSGALARSYLEHRGLLPDAIAGVDLGVVPIELLTMSALRASGFSDLEIAQSGVLADGRWPGRLCGAWRDEHALVGTLWARSVRDSDTSTRYLYLRGASRSELPPCGLTEVLRLQPAERRELLLVEGLIDVHSLRADGFSSVAAVGGARLSPQTVARLGRAGIESVVLAFDNDDPGREGTSKAIDAFTKTGDAPTLRVLEPTLLGEAKDPDAFVREHGIGAFRGLLDKADCAIRWRAHELLGPVAPADDLSDRRAALARTGTWLGTLSSRYALEQEDAVRSVADQCGYSRTAVERAFHARYWDGCRRVAHDEYLRPLVIER